MESEYYMQQNTSPFLLTNLILNNIPYLALHPNIYNMPSQWCRTEKMHNTRLFITLDTPHQGAKYSNVYAVRLQNRNRCPKQIYKVLI